MSTLGKLRILIYFCFWMQGKAGMRAATLSCDKRRTWPGNCDEWSSCCWTVRLWPGQGKVYFNSQTYQPCKWWILGWWCSHGIIDLNLTESSLPKAQCIWAILYTIIPVESLQTFAFLMGLLLLFLLVSPCCCLYFKFFLFVVAFFYKHFGNFVWTIFTFWGVGLIYRVYSLRLALFSHLTTFPLV